MSTSTLNEKFTRIFVRLNNGWANINAMREIAEAGVPLATEIVDARHKSFVDSLVSDGLMTKLIKGMVDGSDLSNTARWLRTSLTEQTLKNASCSVDAASLVFAHTVLDDAVTSFLEITCEVAVEFWRRRAAQKKVELGKLLEMSVEEVTRQAVQNEFRAMSRESLLKRADLLHGVCIDFSAPMGSYKYDRATLVRIDKVRQDIVHGEVLGKEIVRIENDLEYLRRTWDYFFMAMHRSFGLQLDPNIMSARSGMRQDES